MTPYQQEHGRWDVTGVPGADGTISIDLMTKLWENESPTQAMASDTEISINDANYDLLAYVCFHRSTNNRVIPLVLTPKNKDAYVCYADSGNALQRRFDYANSIITAKTGYIGSTVDNTYIILYQIYGIKLHHTVEIKAIAPTVSTLAENCVFDPTGTDLESTDVEAAIKELEANFQAGVDDIYDAVVAKGSTPASHSLSDVVDGIAAIPGATIHTATYTASSSSSALDMGENHNYRYVDTSALTKVSSTKSITANGNSQDVKSYQYVNVNVPNTVSAAVVAAFDVRSASSAYSFTRSSGYAYMVVAHTDDGTVGAYGIINSAGTIQSWQGSTDYFTLKRNSATSFTLSKKSGDAAWSGFIFRAL